ncbi:LytTR family DNA-binding domain-containing protein [Rheinheimera sp.]|uniref:LytR/AlgR family response regulator transcription factor n=1 Tax=Rheinheimera sp. TaxID=1869214 RepID=UPI0027B9DFBE|nr:LytTR family DNA-binding domain-containing protein [Rheinheimera sp.]
MHKQSIINTLLVDDEPAAIEGLRLRLQAFPQIHIIGEAHSVAEALTLINNQQLELIFLDIDMPGQSGFELIRHLQPELCPAIIFVTAFHQYAVKAFEVRALDYLLKPVKLERLVEAITRVSEFAVSRAGKAQMLQAIADITEQNRAESGSMPGSEPSSVAGAVTSPALPATKATADSAQAIEPQYCIERQKLVIQDGRSPIQLIPYQDIIWIDAAGDYMCVHTQSETYVMRARLKSLINERLPDVFVQIHKSTVVNLTYIEQLLPLGNTEYKAILHNKKMLKVSRTYARALKLRLLG